MDYFERLIRRALQRPRDALPSLFDPFAQVGPSALDAPRPALEGPIPFAAVSESVAVLAPPPLSALADALSAMPTPPVRPLPPPHALDGATRAARPTLPSILAGVSTAAVSPEPAAPSGQSGKQAAIAPQAQADAFMRALGVRPVVEAALPAVAPAGASAPAMVSPAVTAAQAAHETAPTPTPAPVVQRVHAPVEVQPMPPRAAVAAAEPRARAAKRAPPERVDTADARAAAHGRSSPPPAPTRVVQTTVVLSPPTRAHDELARGSAMSYFGLGQT